jgi:hypothetical protein
VLYGVRAAVHEVYQGNWTVPPFSWLARLLRAGERRVRQRRDRRAEVLLEPLAVSLWVSKQNFGPISSTVILSPRKAQRVLRRAREQHDEIIQHLKERRPWRARHTLLYGQLLTATMQLKANQARLPASVRDGAEQLVAAVAEYYNKPGPEYADLRRAFEAFQTEVQHEYDEAATRLSRQFPDNERWLRPTRLGNVAVVQELYPLDRYGIELSELWPRIKEVIPKETCARVEEANIYLDFTVLMSLCALLGALLAVGAALWGPDRPLGVRIVLPLALLAGFWLFYQLAIRATLAFGMQVNAAVDLYRFKLLDALSVQRPKTVAEERERWQALRQFLVEGIDPGDELQFKGDGSKPPAEPASAPAHPDEES